MTNISRNHFQSPQTLVVKTGKCPAFLGLRKSGSIPKVPGEPHKSRKVTSAPWVGFVLGIEVAGLDGL